MKFVVVANGVFNDVSALSSLLFLFTAVALATTTQAGQFGVIDPPYKDPTVPVEDRLSILSIEFEVKIELYVQFYGISTSKWSVLNGGESAPSPDTTVSEWADMIDGFQRSALSTRLGIPIIYGTDAVHGLNNVYGATVFPHNVGLGAARDENLMVRIGKASALEIRATGIPYTFAPCIAVCRDPRWGRCYESYGEDTELVRKMSKIILGLQGVPPHNHTYGYPFVGTGESRNVMACAKHYAGDGGTEGGVNEYNTVASYPEFFKIHMKPYLDALAMGVSTVMASYSSWNGVKMHANKFLLTRVLKQQLGFQGFIITDWEGIDRMTSPPGSDYKNSVKTAINAGIDMVMIPNNYQRFIKDLSELVLCGEVPMDRIDDAVRRILRVKFISGIFDQPMADRSLLGMVGHEKHRELAREAVRKSLVLLRNQKIHNKRKMLPLNRKAPKILVAGTHANNIGYQCGGWTITWAGKSGNTTIGTTILEGIKSKVSKRTQVVFEEKPDQQFINNNSDFSYAIVVVGEPPYVESSGDNKELTLPADGVETIQNVCEKLKCLVIVVSGRPVVIEPYVEMMDALVAAWLPGSEAGKGIADVIFGDYDFHGKLPRTWFRRVDQLPMNWGDLNYDPLYPFGYGLKMNLSQRSKPRIIPSSSTPKSSASS
ncbi:hypothetical protein Scep_016220 [Stephania cephalantha]|uniref:Beta-glucosidase n=1 Tax=Stephania cephalantha TaxID=152367 RepID=A0AAP0IP51_9MAGN